MRKTTDRIREEAKARADDRDLTSRTDLKRQEQSKEEELKRLALELVGLKPAQLGRLQLDAVLLEAIQHAQSLGDRKARGRQVGVVRQQLRSLAAAAHALAERVTALKAGMLPSAPPVAQAPAVNEGAEQWLERFIGEGEAALEEFLLAYPEADRQALRQGLRAMQRALNSGVTTGAGQRATTRLREELLRWL